MAPKLKVLAVANQVLSEQLNYRYLTETEVAREALEALRHETVIGLDTETYWDPAVNHTKISLIQIVPRGGVVLVIDLLSVEVALLKPIVESADIMMVAHNARFDEGMLVRAGLQPASFVDTLRLARSTLRLPSYSLASVAAHLTGVELDKSYQRSNWRRRPLTAAQLHYAALDARITLQVFDELQHLLSAQGRLEPALQSARLMPVVKEEGQRSIKRRAPQPPPRPLTDEERRIVTYLKKWRLEKSFAERVPAYMICADRTLEHLALCRPRTLEELTAIHGLGASKVAKFGSELLAALQSASI